MDLSSFRKNVLGLICLVVTAVILLAGLWPFNFRPENKVRWLQDQNGVEFFGQSIIYSTIPFFQHSNIPINSISVELCLQSVTDSISHIGHIFSILDDHGSEIFFVGQWRSHLLLGKGIHGKKTYREVGIRDALKKGEKRFVTITSGTDGTNIYADGILLKSSPRFHLFSMNEKPSGRIILGNSPRGGEYWTGNLLSLAIYDRALTGEEVSRHSQSEGPKEEGLIARYLFDEHSGTSAHDSVGGYHLVIPPRFQVLKKTILVPPWEDFRFTRSYLMDIVTNILGFIPFGFFLSAYLRMRKPHSNFRLLLMATSKNVIPAKAGIQNPLTSLDSRLGGSEKLIIIRGSLISIIIAGCISLSIELIQVYLPTRNSQLTDVITNTIGAIIGVILFSKYHKKLTCNP